MEDARSSDSGSFTTGFTLGLFAGAVGYFLFGTKDGRNIRQKIAREWDQAKEKLVEESGLDSSSVTLRDLATSARRHILEVLDGMAREEQGGRLATKKETETGESKSSKTPRKKKQLFKGV